MAAKRLAKSATQALEGPDVVGGGVGSSAAASIAPGPGPGPGVGHTVSTVSAGVSGGREHGGPGGSHGNGSSSSSEAITVGMRLRPLINHELGQAHCIKIRDNVVSIDGDVTGTQSQDFAFDFAMDSTDPNSDQFCSQEECYEKMGRRMLNHMLEGYHTCLFCYGQTGTGKTTTIMGKSSPPSEQGLLLRLIFDIYEEVDRLKKEGLSVEVKVQMLEVYNERLNDLLCDPQTRKKSKLDIRVHPEIGVYVMGATPEFCESADNCMKLIDFGNTMKTVHATAMNAQSSRGHTVFKLILERRNGGDHSIITSEVYFADLAGRENERTTQVTGDRLQELTFINRSLMWLANCINSLGGGREAGRRMTVTGGTVHRQEPKRDMAKFRNSKLTLLLSNALSGNSRTAMVGTLSPAVNNFEESYSTLKFAKTVKNIRLEAKVATAVDKESLVQKLQQEIQELRKQLADAIAQRDNFGMHDLSDRLDLNEALVTMHQKKNTDMKREALEQNKLRMATMERLGGLRKSLSTVFGEQDLPCLSNYSTDPHLAFKVVFHLPPDGKERVMGYADDCDFGLPAALGVSSRMAVVKNNNGAVFIRPEKVQRLAKTRLTNIEVNRKRLNDITPQRLQHLDCVVFGRSTIFYVFTKPTDPDAVMGAVVTQEKMQEEGDLPPQETERLLLEILGEDRAQEKVQISMAKQYWAYQLTQHQDVQGQKVMQQWLLKAKEARRMVEDANDISENLRPNYCFELVCVAPVLAFGPGSSDLPDLAVQLLGKVSATKTRWHRALQDVRLRTFRGVAKDAHAKHLQGDLKLVSDGDGVPNPVTDDIASFEGLSSRSSDASDADDHEAAAAEALLRNAEMEDEEAAPHPADSHAAVAAAAVAAMTAKAAERASQSQCKETAAAAASFVAGKRSEGAPQFSSSRWNLHRNSITSDDGLAAGAYEVLAVWSYEKFRARLELMYTLNDEWEKDREGFRLDAKNDAWAEHGPAEISELQNEADEELREVRQQLADSNAEVQRLRGLLAIATSSRSLSNHGSMLSNFSSNDLSGRPQAPLRHNSSSLSRLGSGQAAVQQYSKEVGWSPAGQAGRCVQVAKENLALLDHLVNRVTDSG